MAAKWEEADNRYLEYVAGIRNRVSADIRALIDTYLHDAVILAASQCGRSLSITLDTKGAPWVRKKGNRLQLLFDGVRCVSGLQDAIGQGILYEEIFVADSCYELSMLLDRSEVTIGFAGVTMTDSV